jgi:hypothetical protein
MIKREKSHSAPHSHGEELPDMTHIQNSDVLHEVSEVNTKPIYKFGFWMIVIVIGTAILMWLFYDMLASREAKNDPPKPIIENTTSKLAPEPRLQLSPGHEIHPLNEMAELYAQQNAWLEGYGWADKSNGTVRIPISEAKKLLLAKGLPVGRNVDTTGMATGVMSTDSSKSSMGHSSMTNASATPEGDWKYGRAVPSGQSGGHANEWHR